MLYRRGRGAFPLLAACLQPTGELRFLSGWVFFLSGAYCLNKKLQNQYSYSQREVNVWFSLFFSLFPSSLVLYNLKSFPSYLWLREGELAIQVQTEMPPGSPQGSLGAT